MRSTPSRVASIVAVLLLTTTAGECGTTHPPVPHPGLDATYVTTVPVTPGHPVVTS